MTAITAPNAINLFRLASLRQQLRLEKRGVKSSGGDMHVRLYTDACSPIIEPWQSRHEPQRSKMSRTIPTMFYLVSKALGAAMRGERVQSKKGSVYGVYNTEASAAAAQQLRKLTLCSTIVQQ